MYIFINKYEKVSSYDAEDTFKNCIYSNVLVIPYWVENTFDVFIWIQLTS